MASNPLPASEARVAPSVRIAAFFREHGLLVGAALAALIVVTAEARQPEAPEAAQRRAEIEQLSSKDREQLQQNVAKWRLLTIDERLRMKSLHELATQPVAQNTMQSYLNWIETIPGQDKSRVLAETDPLKRAKLVSQMRQEHRPKPGEYEPRRPDMPDGPRNEFPMWSMPMNPQEFNEVMLIIARVENITAPPPESSIETRIEFHFKVFDAYMKQRGGRGNMNSTPLDKATVEEIATKISQPQIRQQLLRGGRQEMIGMLMAKGLFDELRLFAGSELTPETERRLLSTLSSKERREFDERPDFERERRLLAMYLREKSPTIGERLQRMIDRFAKQSPPPGPRDDGIPRRPGGPFGPGGNRPEDRRPPGEFPPRNS